MFWKIGNRRPPHDGEGSDFDAGFYGESFGRLDALGEDRVSSLLDGMSESDRHRADEWGRRLKSMRDEATMHRERVASAIAITAIIVAIVGIVTTHLDAVRALVH